MTSLHELVDIPERRLEPLDEPQEPEVPEDYMQCVGCERVEPKDWRLKFQLDLGTCDRDECLEPRVKELLAAESALVIKERELSTLREEIENYREEMRHILSIAFPMAVAHHTTEELSLGMAKIRGIAYGTLHPPQEKVWIRN